MMSPLASRLCFLVLTFSALLLVGAQPRRGPPRGSIKEDKSTFFGKEGEQAQKESDPLVSLIVRVAVVVLGAAVVYVQFVGGKNKKG